MTTLADPPNPRTCRAESATQQLVGTHQREPQRRVSPVTRRRPTRGSAYIGRPILLGYLRRDVLPVDSQVGVLQREMARFAAMEGFAMGLVYVEQPEPWLTAFKWLMGAIGCSEATAVVLPSLLHFIGLGLGAPTNARSLFEQATGAQVLVLAP